MRYTNRHFTYLLTYLLTVGAGNDRLQLIKFRPSCAPGKGVCGGAKIFGSAYYSQRAVFASL